MGGICSCHCHTGPYKACDTAGGCGSTGCANTAPKPGSCVTCPTLRPTASPRQPHHPPVCDGDRRLIGRHLTDIAHHVTDLTNPEQPVVDNRRYQRIGVEYLKNGRRQAVGLGETWADPLAAMGGVAPINSKPQQPGVSGSRERPIPIPVTALDLQTPLRPKHHLRPLPTSTHDQIGQLPAAVVLAEWIRDIRDTVWPDHHLPKPAVDELTLWLRTRLDDICDRYPDVAVFAEAIRILRGVLRAAAGETEPPPERCEGVPCRRCDLQMLYRQPGGDVECVNPDCRAVLRDDEYRDWVKTLAVEVRVKQRQHT